METEKKIITNKEAEKLTLERIKEKERVENPICLNFYNDAFNVLRDNTKGLLLMGGVGTGKTAFFRGATRCSIVKCSDLAMSFSEKGIKAFTRKVKSEHYEWGYSSPEIIVYDDLGTEPIESFYMGNKLNIMAYAIEIRYDYFKKLGTLSHFTTNLDLKTIAKRYGERSASRLKEMVNVLAINGKDLRSNN